MAHIQIEPRTEIGKLLEEKRIDRGLSRDDIPEEAGISLPTYRSLLRYIPDVTNHTVGKLAEFLEVEKIQIQIWLEEDRRMGGYVALFSQPIPLAA